MGELINLMEKLSLLETEELNAEMEIAAIPPANVEESDEEAIDVEEEAEDLPVEDLSTLANYPKSRIWTQERELAQFPVYNEYPEKFLDPELTREVVVVMLLL
uniref:Uncharacterized protein n=1 Tax=Ditylenchus dipsaci TaxID=166011 RepID=A0A915DIM7_9BILA